MFENQINEISKRLAKSKYLVIFTGAGISTASGLPDFRGPKGIWTLRDKGIKPKPLGKPWNEFEPNPAHKALFDLQSMHLMHMKFAGYSVVI